MLSWARIAIRGVGRVLMEGRLSLVRRFRWGIAAEGD
jgi:hypothetical protein